MNEMSTTGWIAFGAIIAALIMREVKISEFRQAWIDGLRADISDYISKAHEWIDLYLDFNAEEDQDKKQQMVGKLDRSKYNAFHVLRRIEMRFKPNDDNGNDLIKKLNELLDPSKLSPPSFEFEWNQLADNAVINARALLKEEWEITKNPLRKLYIFIMSKYRPNKANQRGSK